MNSTKLYELKRGSFFRITVENENGRTPTYHDPSYSGIYKLDHIDGMYSFCYDKEGNIRHFAAYAPVIEVKEEDFANQ